MISIVRMSCVCALLAGPFDSCSSKPDESPKPAATAATLASAAPTAAPAATAAASSEREDFCKAQGYKRRCDPGCKAAHAKAVSTTCGKETQAFTAAVPNQAEFGKCLIACRKPTSDGSCVGAPDREGCECQLACYRALPPDAIEKAKVAARCYNREVASACE
jgi:hypothetical protein